MLCFFMYYYSSKCVAITLAVLSVLTVLCGGGTIWLAFFLNKSEVW